MGEKIYKTEECGLLIGLINVPMGTDLTDFYQNEIQNTIFRQYREPIFGIDTNKKTSNPHSLYFPHAYHLLGEHNLAVLSLVDDFAFAQRVFHSSHCFPRTNEFKTEDYMIRTVTGISTYPGNKKPRLWDTACHTFLLSEMKGSGSSSTALYPFIGIVRYKLNNGLLIGNGQDYLEAVKSLLKKKQPAKTAFILIDSFCNNELTLVVFAHDPREIIRFVTSTRQYTAQDLSGRKKLYQQALQGATQKKKNSKNEFLHLHLFSSSHTLLGFDLNLFYNTKWQEKIKTTFPVKFYWDIKPGHINNVSQALNKIIKNPQKKKIIIGASSLVYEQEFTLKEYISFLNTWKKRGEVNRNDIRHLRISMEIEADNEILEENHIAEHPLNPLFSKIKIGEKQVHAYQQQLLQLGIPKVLEQRLRKVFVNFNDCITDPLFSIYFMELYYYLSCLKTIIKDATQKGSLEDLHETLNSFITNFEKAYYNRFHHSNRIIDQDDFNLEYNGGIQQLLSGFDAIYKYICRLVSRNLDSEPSQNSTSTPSLAHVVCVSGYERVYSDQFRMMINILYITYPELFAATVCKEALNFYFDDDYLQNFGKLTGNRQFDFLFDHLQNRNFPDFLRGEISRHPDFNEYAYSHRILQQAWDTQLLNYILVDGIVLKCGYREDFRLFYYWYWKVFLQMNHLMEKDNPAASIQYQPDNFITLLFRVVYRAYCLDQQEKQMNETSPPNELPKSKIDEIRYTPFDPTLKELWLLHFNDVYNYVRILYQKFQVLDVNPFIDTLVDNIYPKPEPSADEGETTIENLTDQERESSLKKRRTNRNIIFQKLINNLLEDIRNNQIIVCEDEQEKEKILFVHLFLQAYLKRSQELDTQNTTSSVRYALQRTEAGKAFLQHDNYTPLLSDPYGGFFILNKGNIRREYYILRSIFYKSIWDFSMRTKREIFLRISEDLSTSKESCT